MDINALNMEHMQTGNIISEGYYKGQKVIRMGYALIMPYNTPQCLPAWSHFFDPQRWYPVPTIIVRLD